MGRKHGAAGWETILGPNISTSEQVAQRAALIEKHPVHATWAEVELWGESPVKKRVRFVSPKESESRAAAAIKDDAEFEVSQKKRTETIAKNTEDETAKRAAAHAREVADKNKQLAAIAGGFKPSKVQSPKS